MSTPSRSTQLTYALFLGAAIGAFVVLFSVRIALIVTRQHPEPIADCILSGAILTTVVTSGALWWRMVTQAHTAERDALLAENADLRERALAAEDRAWWGVKPGDTTNNTPTNVVKIRPDIDRRSS